MFVTEFFLSEFHEDEILEAAQPVSVSGGGPMRAPMRGPMAPPSGGVTGLEGPPPSGLTQFEDIKKYILFGKLKDIKRQLDLADLNKDDPQIIQLLEFVDLIVYFYNSFTYEQINHIMDILSEVIATQLKIKLPDRVISPPNREDMPDPPPTPEEKEKELDLALKQKELNQKENVQANSKNTSKSKTSNNQSNNKSSVTDASGNRHVFIHHVSHKKLPTGMKIPELTNGKNQEAKG